MNISGFRTHSTPGGGEHDANVLSFDDTMGSEMFYQHAQKDMTIHVENDQTYQVDNDQNITVTGNRNETVEQGDESVEIAQGDRTHTISQGDDNLIVKTGDHHVRVLQGSDRLTTQKNVDRHILQGFYFLEVDEGDHEVTLRKGDCKLNLEWGNHITELGSGADSLQIRNGDRVVDIRSGGYALKIVDGDHVINLTAGRSEIRSDQSISLVVGDNSITIDSCGVTIKGVLTTIQADSTVTVRAPLVNIN